jgi:hypothetical protein
MPSVHAAWIKPFTGNRPSAAPIAQAANFLRTADSKCACGFALRRLQIAQPGTICKQRRPAWWILPKRTARMPRLIFQRLTLTVYRDSIQC